MNAFQKFYNSPTPLRAVQLALSDHIAAGKRPDGARSPPFEDHLNRAIALLQQGPRRMWVNQPSTLQPEHANHGRNVLVLPEESSEQFVRVYWLDGPVTSQLMAELSLSEGWR